MAKLKIGTTAIDFPRDISTAYDQNSRILSMHLSKPDHNLQDDPAAFEGWSLVLKAKNACAGVLLSFRQIELNKSGYFNNLSVSQQHYMRFLYRLIKFENQFHEWFKIDDSNRHELAEFNKRFSSMTKTNTVPDSPATYNPSKGLEHVLEKAFSTNRPFRTEVGIDLDLYDQLPNGLFAATVLKKNRIFSTGYFDLWGIDRNGGFCVFELKEPDNRKVGIISELFFYSNYACDLLSETNNFVINRTPSNYRNYHLVSTSNFTSFKGIFLISSFHPQIESSKNEIVALLNTNSAIEYSYLHYSIDEGKLRGLKAELDVHFRQSRK